MPSPITTAEVTLEIELEEVEVNYRYSAGERDFFDRSQEQWYPGSSPDVDIDSVQCLIRIGTDHVDIGPWLKQYYQEKIERLVLNQILEEV